MHVVYCGHSLPMFSITIATSVCLHSYRILIHSCDMGFCKDVIVMSLIQNEECGTQIMSKIAVLLVN